MAAIFNVIVRWKPLNPILSKIETLLPKTRMRVTAMAPKQHNQSEHSDQIWAMTTPNANEDTKEYTENLINLYTIVLAAEGQKQI